jgi:hypothetical protein
MALWILGLGTLNSVRLNNIALQCDSDPIIVANPRADMPHKPFLMTKLGFRLECEFVYNGDHSREGGGRAGRGRTYAGAGCLSAFVVQALGAVAQK